MPRPFLQVPLRVVAKLVLWMIPPPHGLKSISGSGPRFVAEPLRCHLDFPPLFDAGDPFCQFSGDPHCSLKLLHTPTTGSFCVSFVPWLTLLLFDIIAFSPNNSKIPPLIRLSPSASDCSPSRSVFLLTAPRVPKVLVNTWFPSAFSVFSVTDFFTEPYDFPPFSIFASPFVLFIPPLVFLV